METHDRPDAEVVIGENGNAVLVFETAGAPPAFALVRFLSKDRADLLRDDESVVRILGEPVVAALRKAEDIMIVETVDGLPVRRYPGIPVRDD